MSNTPAGTEFEVRVVKGRFSWLVAAAMFLPLLLADLLLSIVGGSVNSELPYPASVIVVRKRDGRELARYEYRLLSEAKYHATDLANRLEASNAAEFARELSLKVDCQ